MNVMLEKKQGNFRMDKLHAILLYECDFNHNNKQLRRDVKYYAEDLELIAKEQYGSRKHHTANDQGLNKELTTNALCQKKQPGALVSNDAKACYDHIVHSVASICLQANGTPDEPLI
jgi:ankyrin repeat protein